MKVKEKLDRIAAETKRSKSFLAGEEPSRLKIIEGIKRGLADAAAGRVVPHDRAMLEIYAVIDAPEANRADKPALAKRASSARRAEK